MKILVCGDAMLDEYWKGEVERISPEAPVPVVRMSTNEARDGAAANVAANCRAMGAEVLTHFSPSGERVLKIRVIAKNQQVCRLDFDYPQEPVEHPGFAEKLAGCGIVIFSDYGKGALSNCGPLIDYARQTGKTVLVDPKGHDYEKYRNADLIKPNVHEMKELVGGWSTEEELTKKAFAFLDRAGIAALLLTRASEGMTLYEPDGKRTNIEAEAREVFDVSGAGDTAIAALACAMSRGYSLVDAAIYANKAAGLACERFGTAVITEAEVFQ